MLLGLMTSNLSNEEQYFTQLAKVAKQQNLDICRFTPQQINTETQEIQAEIVDENQNKWVEQTVPLPEFIYDRTFHGLTRDTNDVTEKINWLKSNIFFLGMVYQANGNYMKHLKIILICKHFYQKQ